MNISNRAMLINLTVTVYTARKLDKKVTSEVAQAHNANDIVGRYNKNLLPIDAPSYKAVLQAANAARSAHYEQTLPWDNDGPRILPAENFLDYSQRMRALKRDFENKVNDFLFEYPALQIRAQRALNGLYNADDYPSVQDLRAKFSMSTSVLPFPSAEDFRVTLDAEDIESIRAEITRKVEASVTGAMRDLYTRAHTLVARMAERLADPNAIFRDSLVINLRELCELLPRLNLTNDAELSTLATRIDSDLAQWEPEELRESKPLRAEIARKAKQIENDMAALMQGFSA